MLTENGEIYTYGEGKYGQLGTGNKQEQDEPVQVQIPVPKDGGCNVRH